MHSRSKYKSIVTMTLAVAMVLQPAIPVLNAFTVRAEELPTSFTVPEILEGIIEPDALEAPIVEPEMMNVEVFEAINSIEVGAVAVNKDFDPYIDAFNFRISAPVTLVGLTDVDCYVTLDYNEATPESSTWTDANYNGVECVSPLLNVVNGTSMDINVKATDGSELIDYGTSIQRIADSAYPYFTEFILSPKLLNYIPDTITLRALAHDTVSPLTVCQGRYRVTGGEWNEWTDGVITPMALSGTCEVDMSGLEQGTAYDFQVRVKDTVNHPQKSTRIETLTVDNTQFEIDETDTIAPWVDPVLEDRTFLEGSLIPDIFITAYDDTDIKELCINLVSFNGEYAPLSIGCIPDNGLVNTMFTWNLKDYLNDFGLEYFDTTVFIEGDYVFEYYVVDATGNRSQANASSELRSFSIGNGEESYSNYEVVFSIVNVKPIVELLNDQTIVEGEVASFTGSFDDPSCINIEGRCFTQGPLEHPDDADWITIMNYGDGTEVLLEGDWNAMPGAITIPDHVYAAAGVYTATLTVCENTNNYMSEEVSEMFYPGCATACSMDEKAEFYTNEYFNWYSEGECAFDTVQVNVTKASTPQTDPVIDLIPTVVLFGNSPAVNVAGVVQVPAGTSFTISANINNLGNPNYNFTFGGVCSGVNINTNATLFISNSLNLTSGNYICTVAVSDADGDVAVASVPVLVATVLGVGDQVPQTSGTIDTDTSGNDAGNVEGSSDQVCDERYILSGYVFNDLDGDNEKDENEAGSAGVLVQVYYEDGLDEIIVAEETTAANGGYQFDLCPGEYKIRINANDLPDGSEVLGDVDRDVEIVDTDINDLNFVLSETDAANGGFNWWIFAILLLIIAGGTVVYLYTGRKPQ